MATTGRVRWSRRAGDEALARFFYSAKADSEDPSAPNIRPSKPLDLMQYLVRPVTPPGWPWCSTVCRHPVPLARAAWREACAPSSSKREPEYQG